MVDHCRLHTKHQRWCPGCRSARRAAGEEAEAGSYTGALSAGVDPLEFQAAAQGDGCCGGGCQDGQQNAVADVYAGPVGGADPGAPVSCDPAPVTSGTADYSGGFGGGCDSSSVASSAADPSC
jgi:hypothetical protein